MKRAFWSATGEVGTFGMLAPFLIAAGVLAALATTDLQGVSQTTVLPIAHTTSSP